MTEKDIEWLKARLHKDNCRQCDLVRELIAEHEDNEEHGGEPDLMLRRQQRVET